MSNKSTYLTGDTVRFTPNCPSLSWAAGMRTVKGLENGMVNLECGDVKLLARDAELFLMKRSGTIPIEILEGETIHEMEERSVREANEVIKAITENIIDGNAPEPDAEELPDMDWAAQKTEYEL